MACSLAVSIGTVAVTNENLLALLTADVVEPLVLAFLNQEYPRLQPFVYMYNRTGTSVSFGLGSNDDCNITITHRLITIINDQYSQRFGQQLLENLTAFLQTAANSLFAQKFQQLLLELGLDMSAAQTVKVEHAGKHQQATILTMTI